MKGMLNTPSAGALALALGLAVSGSALGHGWDAGGRGFMRGFGPQAGAVCHGVQRQAMRTRFPVQRQLGVCPYAGASLKAGEVPADRIQNPGPYCPFRTGGPAT